MRQQPDIHLVEMAPRDGLQNESVWISTEDKIALVDGLSATGLSAIEVTSFVSPKWVPQMADASAVMQGIQRHKTVKYAALTPNLHGYRAALAAGVDEVAVFTSASESFAQKNTNCSIAENFNRFSELLQAAKRAGIRVRAYVSCVAVCPYDGVILPSAVSSVVERLLANGCYQVSLGDTVGRAKPEQIDVLLKALLDISDPEQLAGHFHDTEHRALENIDVSLAHGLRCFDAAVGGLGGCPYAPGAKGNVDTVSVVEHLQRKGYETGVDLDAVKKMADFVFKISQGKKNDDQSV